MPVPTVSSITPPLGLGSGMTLVEIEGSGFRLPLPPAEPGPSDQNPRSTVRVRIGGRSAQGVMVYEDGYLTCLTPEGDPFEVSFAATASAATNVFAAPGHTFKDGDRLCITGTLPAPLLAPDARDAVPLYARDIVAGVSFKVALSVGGAAVDLTTAGGALTVTSEGYTDVELSNLDDQGAPIAGETVVLTRAYSYRLPDLTAEAGSIVMVVRSLILMLRRSIHKNVVFTTHTDYDDTTGAQLNVAAVASLPALVLTNIDLPEDRQRAAQGTDAALIEGGRFIEHRQPVICDLTATLVGASDDETEFFNLLEATRLLFQKRDKLRVPRSIDGSYDDGIDYELAFKFGPVNVTAGDPGGNPNLKWFGGTISVEGIRLEAVPGAPTAGTAAKPSGQHHEATIAIGYTAETIKIQAGKKDPDG